MTFQINVSLMNLDLEENVMFASLNGLINEYINT